MLTSPEFLEINILDCIRDIPCFLAKIVVFNVQHGHTACSSLKYILHINIFSVR